MHTSSQYSELSWLPMAYAIASIAVMRLHAYYIEPSILVATPR